MFCGVIINRRCRRTSCPPGHLVLGLDVPRRDGLSPPHNLATEFQRGSVSGSWHGEMVLEYDHLYNYAAFSRYPTGSSKNQHRIIRHKYIENFHAEDRVLYYSACGRVCE